jgi:DNA repair protein RecO (recombination protein O)
VNVSRPPDGQGRVLLEHALILHCQPYRESSLFVDVISQNHGRIRLLGKGVKRGKHPLSHILRPFANVRLSWAGRNDLPLLTAAESVGQMPALMGEALFCGFYVNELLLYLLPPQDPQPEVYCLYRDVLGQLVPGRCLQTTLRFFELSLLTAIGYGPQLEYDTGGSPIDPAKTYDYLVEQGPRLVEPGQPTAIAGATLLGLSRRCLTHESQLREAKHLLRSIIQYYLNGRPLRSRELFKPFNPGLSNES